MKKVVREWRGFLHAVPLRRDNLSSFSGANWVSGDALATKNDDVDPRQALRCGSAFSILCGEDDTSSVANMLQT